MEQRDIEKQIEINQALRTLQLKREEFNNKFRQKDLVHEWQIDQLRIKLKNENEEHEFTSDITHIIIKKAVK